MKRPLLPGKNATFFAAAFAPNKSAGRKSRSFSPHEKNAFVGRIAALERTPEFVFRSVNVSRS